MAAATCTRVGEEVAEEAVSYPQFKPDASVFDLHSGPAAERKKVPCRLGMTGYRKLGDFQWNFFFR